MNVADFEQLTEPQTSLEAKRLNWMEKRVGYGRVDAPYWFVGMEESGHPDEIAARMSAPFLEDLYEAHSGAFAGRYDKLFHLQNATVQATWGKLIRTLLVAKGGEASLADIKHYQATRWGRRNGETLLSELYPVASPRLSTDEYKQAILPARIRLLRGLYERHKPRFVVAYGTTYAKNFKRVFGDAGAVWRRLTEDPTAGEFYRNIAIVRHPTAFGQTNARFDLIGRWARQFSRGTDRIGCDVVKQAICGCTDTECGHGSGGCSNLVASIQPRVRAAP